MLVLSRKANEAIKIGDNVTVEIRRIAGNRVTVAINAPRDVRILRGELEAAVKEFEEEPLHTEEGAAYSITEARAGMPRLHNPGIKAQAVG